MYAIIATGGKQYKVSEGDIITIEKLGVDALLRGIVFRCLVREVDVVVDGVVQFRIIHHGERRHQRER